MANTSPSTNTPTDPQKLENPLKTFLLFLLYMVLAVLVILMAILLGDSGAWYFAWLVGTTMIVLIAAAGGILLDAQDTHDGPRAPAVKPN